jgi:hypothetical protein
LGIDDVVAVIKELPDPNEPVFVDAIEMLGAADPVAVDEAMPLDIGMAPDLSPIL